MPAPAGFAENTPTAPNGNGKPAEAGFSRVFRGSRLSFLGRAGSNRRVGPPECCFGHESARNGHFLDVKRGFLPSAADYGEETRGFRAGPGRAGEERFLDPFWTPFGHFWPVSAKRGLYYLRCWKEPAQAGSEPAQKVANMQPFPGLLDRKTCFSVYFSAEKWIQAAPLIGSVRESDDLSVTFVTKRVLF